MNSIFTIRPYDYHGTWVFDDPSTGLFREAFVSGMGEILDNLVVGIPKAKRGFTLLFSASQFPGADLELTRQKEEFGGNWYVTNTGERGWLCPALFLYFPTAPKKLFAQAKP